MVRGSLLKTAFTLSFLAFAGLCTLGSSAHAFQGTGTVKTIYSRTPFLALGDLGQYVKTMSSGREEIRKRYWNDLTEALDKMAQAGAQPDTLVQPLTDALMLFDLVYDDHKYRDSVGVDFTLESTFKSYLDQNFKAYGLPQSSRKFQFSARTDLGLDYGAYGTFSSLGQGNFQLTWHLQDARTGKEVSFTSSGRLLEATAQLASQVFDFFQRIEEQDWTPGHQQLQWLAQPMNPYKEGYSFEEAQQYCRARGFRLPYARELLDASSGSQFRKGGIEALAHLKAYPVTDRRMMSDRYVLVPGTEDNSNGPLHGASSYSRLGRFYCVKGAAQAEVLLIEELWKIRRASVNNREVIRAVDTLRFELGDWGSETTFWGKPMQLLKRMNSPEEALAVLKKFGYRIKYPL